MLFTFNGCGSTRFAVNGQVNTPEAGAGVAMISSTQGQYLRGKGGGIVLATRPHALLQTARAIQGPLAEQQRLQVFAYGSGAEPSLPRSLLQSLHLVDSLLSPMGSLPAALRLDDLICRQLVLMLCPELGAEEAEASSPPLQRRFRTAAGLGEQPGGGAAQPQTAGGPLGLFAPGAAARLPATLRLWADAVAAPPPPRARPGAAEPRRRSRLGDHQPPEWPGQTIRCGLIACDRAGFCHCRHWHPPSHPLLTALSSARGTHF